MVQIASAIEQISSVVQTNSATAEESAAASEELSGQAQLLKNLADRFQLRQEDSTETVRYALHSGSENVERWLSAASPNRAEIERTY